MVASKIPPYELTHQSSDPNPLRVVDLTEEQLSKMTDRLDKREISK